MSKSERVEIRATPEELENWKRQAAEKQIGLSEWIRSALNNEFTAAPVVKTGDNGCERRAGRNAPAKVGVAQSHPAKTRDTCIDRLEATESSEADPHPLANEFWMDYRERLRLWAGQAETRCEQDRRTLRIDQLVATYRKRGGKL